MNAATGRPSVASGNSLLAPSVLYWRRSAIEPGRVPVDGQARSVSTVRRATWINARFGPPNRDMGFGGRAGALDAGPLSVDGNGTVRSLVCLLSERPGYLSGVRRSALKEPIPTRAVLGARTARAEVVAPVRRREALDSCP